MNAITVDIRSGAFGGNAALMRADDAASATATGVASAAPPDGNGGTVDISLPASALSAATAPVARRSACAPPPVDFTSDTLTIAGGESAGTAPTLTVTH